jgi:hypothetical protein
VWPLGHVGHVTYSFIHMLFISTGIFDDKLRPQILLIGTTANAALRMVEEHHCKTNFLITFIIFSFCWGNKKIHSYIHKN